VQWTRPFRHATLPQAEGSLSNSSEHRFGAGLRTAGGRQGPQFGRVMVVDGENLRRWKVDGPRPGLGALSHFGWSEERPAVHSLKLVARSGGAGLQGCLHEKRIKGRRWDKLRRMNHIG